MHPRSDRERGGTRLTVGPTHWQTHDDVEGEIKWHLTEVTEKDFFSFENPRLGIRLMLDVRQGLTSDNGREWRVLMSRPPLQPIIELEVVRHSVERT